MEYRLMYMYQGMKLEDYLKYTGSSMEELRKSKAEDAKRDVKTRLTLEAIVKAEKLDVTDEELEAEVARVAESAGKKGGRIPQVHGRKTAFIHEERFTDEKAYRVFKGE